MNPNSINNVILRMAFFLSALLGLSLHSQAAETLLLSKTRSSITMPEYTSEQRLLLARQAQKILIGANGNLQSRIKTLGSQVDPTAEIQQLVVQAPFMQTLDLQLKLSELFRRQMDGHLNFYFPAPYSCYVSMLPLRFGEYTDSNGKVQVAVRSITAIPLTNQPPYDELLRQITIGDVLLTYDGQSIDRAIEDLKTLGYGLNSDAMRARAISAMAYRQQSLLPIPEKDFVELSFLRTDGTTYTLNMPWYVSFEDKCIRPNGTQTPSLRTTIDSMSSLDNSPMLNGVDLIQKLENGIAWGTITDSNGKFGYIQLSDFAGTVKFANKAVPATDLAVLNFGKILQRLETEFQVQGLIIDVRRNSGGAIAFAEGLVQLLSPHLVQQSTFRLVNNSFYKQLALSLRAQGQTWFERFATWLLNPLIAEHQYTPPLPFSDESVRRNNSYGQRFHQPIALLTDATCFSSCEQFVALAKDNGIATVWGEQRLVGGGGGNVWGYETFARLDPIEFPALPGGQNMRTPTFQTVRAGKSKNTVMEEIPLSVDILRPKSLYDLKNKLEESFSDITSSLNKSYDSQFKVQFPEQLFWEVESISTDNVVPVGIQGIDLLVIKNGQQQIRHEYDPTHMINELILPRPPYQEDLQYEISGFRQGVKKFRRILFLTQKAAVFSAGKESVTLSSEQIKPFAKIQNTLDGSGWAFINNQWQTISQKSGVYGNMEFATLTFTIDATLRKKLSLSLNGRVETTLAQSDYLLVLATPDDGNTQILAKLLGKIQGDGQIPAEDKEDDLFFNLDRFAGKRVKIDFIFCSDFVRAEGFGVKIKDFVLH